MEKVLPEYQRMVKQVTINCLYLYLPGGREAVDRVNRCKQTANSQSINHGTDGTVPALLQQSAGWPGGKSGEVSLEVWEG
jgi:hypothetical protein